MTIPNYYEAREECRKTTRLRLSEWKDTMVKTERKQIGKPDILSAKITSHKNLHFKYTGFNFYVHNLCNSNRAQSGQEQCRKAQKPQVSALVHSYQNIIRTMGLVVPATN